MSADGWTEEQTSRLREYRDSGFGYRQCAAMLGKTRHEVRHKWMRIERESRLLTPISETALTFYDQACLALAAARETDQAKDIRDKAEALRHYARQAKNRELEVDAAEIRLRAERRIGELIRDQKATVGLATGGQPYQKATGSEKNPVEKPTLADAGIDKRLADRARKLAVVPEKTFESRITAWREEAQAANERISLDLIREGDKAERRAVREADLGAKQCALPAEKFGVILADPEWRFEPWSRRTGMDRAADNHYPTSATEVIAARDVPSIAADDCVLFLWATIPMLPHALLVMEAWGFDYKSHYAWGKDKIGPGYWNREKHELLLIGTRGKIPCPAQGTQRHSLLMASRGKHSAKPDLFIEMIEAYYPTLPKIELNRRGPVRLGWKAWGNESESPPPTATNGPTSSAHSEARSLVAQSVGGGEHG
jgi:N6-adenosine-specific RNA methylase IME4